LGDFDEYILVFDLIKPVTARSIMPVLSKATTNHPLFSLPTSDITYSLSVKYSDNTEAILFAIKSTNKVQSLTASTITQVTLSLKRVGPINLVTFQ
jgi:hypothetical protein